MLRALHFISPFAAALVIGTTLLLEPGSAALAQDRGRTKPEVPIDDMQGRLSPPAAGRPLLDFGERTQFGHSSKGMVIETRHGAQVTAPSDGWVVFAGDYRGYGKTIIINAGNGYHVVLAGLGETDVELGQFVVNGQPLGTMPRTTAADQPVLYFEMRKDGQAIDPAPWLRKN